MQGEELKTFKQVVNTVHDQFISNKTTVLTLWTERGVTRHAKILDTDEAWFVYEQLEDTYFKTKQNVLPKGKEGFEFELSLLGFTMDRLKVNEGSKILMIGNFGKAHNMDTSYLPSYTNEKITKSLSELLKQFNVNISPIKFNKLLLEKGIIIECERPSSKGGVKKFKSIVNEEYGKNLVSTSNQKETQPHYYEDKFQELINLVI